MLCTQPCSLNVTSDAARFSKVTFCSERGYVVEFVSQPNASVCSSWLLLPGENLWPEWLRGCLYLVALAYIFVGIAIVSDLFMGSIEVITSKKRKVTVFDPEKRVAEEQEVLLWNETVANLTLMALGSSAPEILLAIGESVQRLGETKAEAAARDGLGTFTIVGSAAFNLLVITAVCIASVPSPHLKKISEFGVFLVTTAWSVFAYTWLLVVLEFRTPGVVEMWEAWITLAFFPLFVLIAWAQDNSWWIHRCKRRTSPTHCVVEIGAVKESKLKVVNLDARPSTAFHIGSIRRKAERRQTDRDSDDLSDDEITNQRRFTHCRSPRVSFLSKAPSVSSVSTTTSKTEHKLRHSLARARFRHVAMKSLMGASVSTGKRFAIAVNAMAAENQVEKMKQTVVPARKRSHIQHGLHFPSQTYSVLRSAKSIKLDVVYGNQSNRDSRTNFHVNASNGGPNQMLHPHSLPATEDPMGCNNHWPALEKTDTRLSMMSVTAAVVNELDRMLVPVTVQYETRDGTAKQGIAYERTEGVLTFEEGESQHSIHVPLLKCDQYNNDNDFYVILKNPSISNALSHPDVARVTIIEDNKPGSFEFDCLHYYGDLHSNTVTATIIRSGGCDGTVTVYCHTIDGTATGGKYLESGIDYEQVDEVITFREGETSKQVTIKINANKNPENKNFVLYLGSVSRGAQIGKQSAAVMILTPTTDGADLVIGDTKESLQWYKSWEVQFQMAMSIGEEVDEDGKLVKPSRLDYLLHSISIFWKVLFATIPPRAVLGGWPAFFISLGYIGVCTILVEQIASLFGCVVGLRTSVTGITLVALGTSLPDTFASRSAAVQEKDADAAIGNITGSNSVNVFLGLGLPWVISACYYEARDEHFHVSRYNLPFSVVVFTSCAAVCVLLLIVRRLVLGGELGGQTGKKWLSSCLLLVLWFLYVLISSLRAYNIISGI